MKTEAVDQRPVLGFESVFATPQVIRLGENPLTNQVNSAFGGCECVGCDQGCENACEAGCEAGCEDGGCYG